VFAGFSCIDANFFTTGKNKQPHLITSLFLPSFSSFCFYFFHFLVFTMSVCQNCFQEGCSQQTFTTPCCKTAYCPKGLIQFLKDSQGAPSKSPPCPNCPLTVEFDAMDNFAKTLKDITTKRELKELLSVRCKIKVLCPGGHPYFSEADTAVLTCLECNRNKKNPFFCSKCRQPLPGSTVKCTSRSCVNP